MVQRCYVRKKKNMHMVLKLFLRNVRNVAVCEKLSSIPINIYKHPISQTHFLLLQHYAQIPFVRVAVFQQFYSSENGYHKYIL